MLSRSALMVAICLTAAMSETIDLGGLRKVQANIDTDDQNYGIRVRFLPVTCFDSTTNREMNLGLGRSFAFQALARHLAGKGDVDLLVSGAQTAEAGQSGNLFSMSLRVPRAGVKVVNKADTPAAAQSDRQDAQGAQLVASDASSLGRKGQYEKMIAELAMVLKKEIKGLRSEGAAGPAAEKIEALKQRIDKACAQLEHEIQGDLELTNLGSDLDPTAKGEKDQLLASLSSMRAKLLQELSH